MVKQPLKGSKPSKNLLELNWNSVIQKIPYKFANKNNEFVYLSWSFTAHSTHWGHVKHGQFTWSHFY